VLHALKLSIYRFKALPPPHILTCCSQRYWWYYDYRRWSGRCPTLPHEVSLSGTHIVWLTGTHCQVSQSTLKPPDG